MGLGLEAFHDNLAIFDLDEALAVGEQLIAILDVVELNVAVALALAVLVEDLAGDHAGDAVVSEPVLDVLLLNVVVEVVQEQVGFLGHIFEVWLVAEDSNGVVEHLFMVGLIDGFLGISRVLEGDKSEAPGTFRRLVDREDELRDVAETLEVLEQHATCQGVLEVAYEKLTVGRESLGLSEEALGLTIGRRGQSVTVGNGLLSWWHELSVEH